MRNHLTHSQQAIGALISGISAALVVVAVALLVLDLSREENTISITLSVFVGLAVGVLWFYIGPSTATLYKAWSLFATHIFSPLKRAARSIAGRIVMCILMAAWAAITGYAENYGTTIILLCLLALHGKSLSDELQKSKQEQS